MECWKPVLKSAIRHVDCRAHLRPYIVSGCSYLRTTHNPAFPPHPRCSFNTVISFHHPTRPTRRTGRPGRRRPPAPLHGGSAGCCRRRRSRRRLGAGAKGVRCQDLRVSRVGNGRIGLETEAALGCNGSGAGHGVEKGPWPTRWGQAQHGYSHRRVDLETCRR